MKAIIFTLLFASQTIAFAEDNVRDTDHAATPIKGEHTIIYSKKLRKKSETVDDSILVLDKIVVRPDRLPTMAEMTQEEIAQVETQNDQ